MTDKYVSELPKCKLCGGKLITAYGYGYERLSHELAECPLGLRQFTEQQWRVLMGDPEPASAEQWIKCSERMPDVGQPVLVHVIYEYPIVGYITSIGWVCYATDEYIAGEPDFWMPLPQPPE